MDHNELIKKLTIDYSQRLKVLSTCVYIDATDKTKKDWIETLKAMIVNLEDYEECILPTMSLSLSLEIDSLDLV